MSANDPVDRPPSPDAEGAGHPGAPRWVKVAVAVTLVIVLVLVISRLAGVEHGPGMHGGDDEGDAPRAVVAATAGSGDVPPANQRVPAQ